MNHIMEPRQSNWPHVQASPSTQAAGKESSVFLKYPVPFWTSLSFPRQFLHLGHLFFFSFSPAWRISGEHFQDTVWNQSLGSDILRIRFKDGICPRVEKAGTPGLERRARQGGNSAPNPAEVAAHVGSVCSPLWACGFLVSEKQKVDFLNVKSQVVFKTLGAAGAKRQTWLWLRSCVISGSWDQAPRQAPCSTYSLFEILSLSQINK